MPERSRTFPPFPSTNGFRPPPPQKPPDATYKLGAAIVGLGGAVATTAVAGISLLREGKAGLDGLPLATLDSNLTATLTGYANIVFRGWDLCGDNLAVAAANHCVLTDAQFADAAPHLRSIDPWPAVGNQAFCHNIERAHFFAAANHTEAIDRIRLDLRNFRAEHSLDGLVMVNLASTERTANLQDPQFTSLRNFREALARNSEQIGPAMLYAYAAISEGVPFINFTPSVAADIPALVEFAGQMGVPLCGKDGKTGQTMLKTALAPALRTRALRVDGWYSANILGNRDGKALDDKDSLQSKLATKASVLDQILGYHVDNHLVDIRYYKPRGDNKESWDNIDVTGFLGQPMQIKVNFLCRDSVLAAPLVIELIRLMDSALRNGERGVQQQFGLFFKSPMMPTAQGVPEHALHVQEAVLLQWLKRISAGAMAGAVPKEVEILQPVAGD